MVPEYMGWNDAADLVGDAPEAAILRNISRATSVDKFRSATRLSTSELSVVVVENVESGGGRDDEEELDHAVMPRLLRVDAAGDRSRP